VDFEVIWTEPAVADLEAVVRLVAEDDPATAEELRVELLSRWKSWRGFRTSGRHTGAIERVGRGRSSADTIASSTGSGNRCVR
jgi:plasmid stabilization system protein ParE